MSAAGLPYLPGDRRGVSMTSRLRGPTLAFIALAGIATPARAADDPPGGDVFEFGTVWQLHLAIPAKEYEAMQPAGGFPGFPGAPGGPPRPAAKPGEPP